MTQNYDNHNLVHQIPTIQRFLTESFACSIFGSFKEGEASFGPSIPRCAAMLAPASETRLDHDYDPFSNISHCIQHIAQVNKSQHMEGNKMLQLLRHLIVPFISRLAMKLFTRLQPYASTASP